MNAGLAGENDGDVGPKPGLVPPNMGEVGEYPAVGEKPGEAGLVPPKGLAGE